MEQNRYLLGPDGQPVRQSRLVLVLLFGGTMLFFVILSIGIQLKALELLIGVCLGVIVLVMASVFAMELTRRRRFRDLDAATDALRANDIQSAVILSQRALAGPREWYMAVRSFYLLGHCAETNGHFAESDDLFGRAELPPSGEYSRKWHNCLMLAHRAIALAGLRRLDEAELVIREAEALYPEHEGALSVVYDAIWAPKAIFAVVEQCDPRVLLALASALVLVMRGRGKEALDVVERHRGAWMSTLFPREKALLANIEAHARRAFGSPMREPGAVTRHPWAESILAPPA
jgi:hypothetical protein